jgi:RNA polymerase sigma-70 factor, ECF subfamily
MNEDLELVAKAQAGDRDAFGVLYGIYIKKVYDFVYFRSANQEVAEDLVSDIFIKVLEKINKFDPAKGSFSSWLYRVARNHVIDAHRVRKSASPLEEISLSDDGRQSREIEDAILFRQAAKLLDNLKTDQREIVLLRVWDELSYSEISAITGKSEAAAKMSFKRAVDHLRRIAPQEWLALLSLILVLKDR